jgi:hypothetical protein
MTLMVYIPSLILVELSFTLHEEVFRQTKEYTTGATTQAKGTNYQSLST